MTNREFISQYFLYRHIRLDTNEVFYIGIGKISKNYLDYVGHCVRKYARAYSKVSRTRFWKNIVSKTLYEVEIIFESNSLEEIKNKEREFIALYGRRDLGLGTLCNLTDGGDGNYNFSPETIEKIANSKRGKKLSFEHANKSRLARLGKKSSLETRLKQSKNSGVRGRIGKLHPTSKPVYQYDYTGNFLKVWECTKEIERELGINNVRISQACNKNHYALNNYWYYEYQGEKIIPTNKIRRTKILKLSLDNFPIEIYNSIKEASILSFGSRGAVNSISRVCNNELETFKGYKWKYAI